MHEDARARIGAIRPGQAAEWALHLVRAPSPNPPLDTRAAAEAASAIIRAAVPQVELDLFEAGHGVVNLVARVCGAHPSPRPGRRIVFNGHLDTYPVGDRSLWTRDPAGQIEAGRLYGRGAADMKGGIAASIAAFAALAAHRDAWPGEVVLTLAGDEESMGPLGTGWLLQHVPHASGDAVILADAGSSRVLRFGEKGFLWIEIEATGHAAHGAHVHLGDNAVERLLAALSRLQALPFLHGLLGNLARHRRRDFTIGKLKLRILHLHLARAHIGVGHAGIGLRGFHVRRRGVRL